MIKRDTSNTNGSGTLQFTNSSSESTEASGTVLPTYKSGQAPLPEGGIKCLTLQLSDMVGFQGRADSSMCYERLEAFMGS